MSVEPFDCVLHVCRHINLSSALGVLTRSAEILQLGQRITTKERAVKPSKLEKLKA
jgi:hypothetical protein